MLRKVLSRRGQIICINKYLKTIQIYAKQNLSDFFSIKIFILKSNYLIENIWGLSEMFLYAICSNILFQVFNRNSIIYEKQYFCLEFSVLKYLWHSDVQWWIRKHIFGYWIIQTPISIFWYHTKECFQVLWTANDFLNAFVKRLILI